MSSKASRTAEDGERSCVPDKNFWQIHFDKYSAHDGSAYDASAYQASAYQASAYDASAYYASAYDASAYDAYAYDVSAYDVWVTRPEHPKGANDEVKEARKAFIKKSGPRGPLDF